VAAAITILQIHIDQAMKFELVRCKTGVKKQIPPLKTGYGVQGSAYLKNCILSSHVM